MSGKFLDDVGLKALWDKIRSSFGFKVDQSLTMKEGLLTVTTPVNSVLTQEEFDELPQEKKEHGLYIIQTEGSPLQGVEIEEYDTTVDGCDWHVRKWSNGYVELMGVKKNSNLTIKTPSGSGLYITSTMLKGPMFPLPLVEKYSETDSASLLSSVAAALLTYTCLQYETDYLIRAYGIYPVRGAEMTDATVYCNYRITGRWK